MEMPEEEVGHMVMLNGVLTETAINTLKQLQCEVPGSVGAKRVVMYECKLIPSVPGNVASAMSVTHNACFVGYKTLSGAYLSDEDCVVAAYILKVCDATPAPLVLFKNGSGELGTPVAIPLHANSGKYYVTVGVVGVNNPAAATQSVTYHMRFVVYR